MACFLLHVSDTSVSIPQTKIINNVTYYDILVKVGPISWTVLQRYNGFLELHETLVSDHSVPKDMLPPKKLIGNKDPAFVEARRLGLQEYLSAVISFLQKRMPRELVLFLNLHLYDILFLLQDFSMYLFREGESLLLASRKYEFCPLTLYAVSERLKQPCPPLEIIDQRHDFSHVLDFCSQLKTLKIEGSNNEFKTSNIIPNDLLFELTAFKTIETLILINVKLSNIYNISSVKDTVKAVSVKRCNAKSLADLLLCDELHKSTDCITEEKKWFKLIEADLSQNEIESTDEFLQLMPNVERLMISENKITDIKDMTALKKLTHLSFSANLIKDIEDLSLCLNNIIYLDLSQNQLSSLKGFSNLKSLEGLDLSSNLIIDLSEIKYINVLPSIDYLNLTGNPVTTVIDYRVKVLEQFGMRASYICLDNEKPTQKELDTVSVLQALRIVKEGRTPMFNIVPPLPNSLP
ncbi:nischarin [Lycorma delicatula]|uniref:nischarin n=1 Tax=Lycorma delicatula TaxID=130591 RepID=UPI003F510D98